MPDVCRTRILSLFTEVEHAADGQGDDKYIMSSRQADLVVAYIMVLALVVYDFVPMPIDALAADLKMNIPK